MVRIGGTIQFRALGEFDTGYYDDITDEVTWAVDPAAVGGVAAGGLHRRARPAIANLTATLGDVHSDAQQITVVDHASVVALSVYPGSYRYQYLDGGPVRPGDAAPCFECGYFLTLLLGDQVQFFATAHYDTGEWEDVTARVTWRSSDAAVMTIDAAGNGTAVGAGEVAIDATLDGVTSAPATVRVVDQATLQNLTIYMDGADRAIANGAQAVFHAIGFYDVGFDRSVSDQVDLAQQRRDRRRLRRGGRVHRPRRRHRHRVGRARRHRLAVAVARGVRHQRAGLLRCRQRSTAAPGRTTSTASPWSPTAPPTRRPTSSSCASRSPRRSARAASSIPASISTPTRAIALVRTIREEGCGDPFLRAGAPEARRGGAEVPAEGVLGSQGRATAPPWRPGEYDIRGRFYLYYDPVVTLRITVE